MRRASIAMQWNNDNSVFLKARCNDKSIINPNRTLTWMRYPVAVFSMFPHWRVGVGRMDSTQDLKSIRHESHTRKRDNSHSRATTLAFDCGGSLRSTAFSLAFATLADTSMMLRSAIAFFALMMWYKYQTNHLNSRKESQNENSSRCHRLTLTPDYIPLITFFRKEDIRSPSHK